jgi:hypothetical protein
VKSEGSANDDEIFFFFSPKPAKTAKTKDQRRGSREGVRERLRFLFFSLGKEKNTSFKSVS